MKEPIFVDTSAFYAVLDSNDTAHGIAADSWLKIMIV